MNAFPSILDQLAPSFTATNGSDQPAQPLLVPSLLHQLELCHLALDRIRQGLCVFDDQQRLPLFNRQYVCSSAQ